MYVDDQFLHQLSKSYPLIKTNNEKAYNTFSEAVRSLTIITSSFV